MRSSLIALFIILLQLTVWSQKTSNSPLSSYGLGETGTLDHASFSGIGNISTPISDSLNMNFYNPASYNSLGVGQPVFSTGISSKFSTFSENGTSYQNKNIGINHFALGIPYGKRLGFGLGLKPFSRKGYEFYDKMLVNTDSMKYIYRGKGSTNQAFLGLSIKVLNLTHHKLSLGTNVSYIFGSVLDTRLAHLTTQETGAVEDKTYQLKSMQYDFGLIYVLKLPYNKALNVGMTYTPNQKLTASKTTNLFYAFNIANEKQYLSLAATNEKGHIYYPSTFSTGLSYTYRPTTDSSYNKTKIPQLIFFTQFTTTNWSSYETSFESDTKTNYSNSINLAFGIEFSPHFNFLDRSKTVTYFHRIKYKLGYQYATLPVERLTKQLTSSNFSLGFSFPIISQRSVSSINFGVTYGKRGAFATGSLDEKFFGVNFGITIAPGTYDRWFRKYKID